MDKISFINIPEDYQSMLKDIKEKTILELYSKFIFLYLSSDQIDETEKKAKNMNQNDIECYILKYLADFRFIAYNIIDNMKKIHSKYSNENDSKEYCFAIFCIEKQCLIIEGINKESINKIITKLKDQQSFCLNCNINIKSDQVLTEEQEEIKNFYSHFLSENILIKQTLPSIIGYMIRRYFYPSHFFKDKSFFVYDQQNFEKEQIAMEKIENFLIDFDPNKLKEIIHIINSKEDNHQIKKQEYKQSDFICLRKIPNHNAELYLVINCDNFKIYLMKKLINSNSKQYEVNFCENYSNRCFVPFCGFLKENDQIIGFLYAYMCNGTLSSFVSKHKNHISEMYSLLVLIRICQGIEYLHSNSLIYRDLKPENILLDNNFIPYISDFETIRKTADKNSSENVITGDMCSLFYASPEQYSGKFYSYPVDIYSFGLTIYFLNEKKNMKTEYTYKNSMKANYNAPNMQNCSLNKQNIYKNCIKYDPNDRPAITEIKYMINEEVNSYFFLKKDLFDENFNINIYEKNQFIFEFLFLQTENSNKFDEFRTSIVILQKLFMLKIKSDYSTLLAEIGFWYFHGENVKQNFKKSVEFYELAAMKNNSSAFLILGNCYLLGLGVTPDLYKAIHYFESGTKHNCPGSFLHLGYIYSGFFQQNVVQYDYAKAIYCFKQAAKFGKHISLCYLGKLYINGIGVKKDFSYAKYLFELAVKQNIPMVMVKLGIIYAQGIGVKQDFLMSRHYFELAAQYFAPDAIFYLGCIYLKGLGVQTNYLESKRLFEFAAKLNFPKAFYYLGQIYEFGYGVQKNYQIAIKYYLLAVKLNIFDAFVNLGNMYLEGLGIEKNASKAIVLYEIAAKSNISEAILKLGEIYYYGRDCVKQNFTKAREYFEILEKQNELSSLYYLAFIYFFGQGVETDYVKARKYFEILAKHFYSSAFYYLGKIYLYGLGIKKDYIQAKKYFELSTSYKNSEAYIELGIICLEEEKDYLKAKQYFELSGQKNNPYVLMCLEYIYFNMYNVNHEYNNAKQFYELTDQQKNSIVLYNIFYLAFCGYNVQEDYVNAKEFSDFSVFINKNGEKSKSSKCYINDFNTERDEYKWKEYFEKAQNKVSGSLYNMGVYYYNGYGIVKDLNRAFKYYELSAKLNNSDALFALGLYYFYGNIVQQSSLKAKQYFELSGSLNNSNALVMLGFFYENGIGVKKDINKAIEFYQKSGKLNNSLGYLLLGILNYQGNSIKKDKLKAIYYLKLSSKMNNDVALKTLGDIYLNENQVIAKQYYESAAKMDNDEAIYMLGYIYFKGYGVQKNYKIAKKYFELAAQKKHSMAFFQLGYIYFNGYGVKPNYNLAISYFEVAAKLYNSESLLILGDIFSLGEVVDIDIQRSIKYYLKCTDFYYEKRIMANFQFFIPLYYIEYNGYRYIAFNHLGLIYLTELNDIEKACQYIKEAAFAEYPPGQNNFGLLNQFYLNHLGNAKYMYKRASQHNFPLAEYNLGYFYENNKKIEKAIKYYIKASNDENYIINFRNLFYYDKKLEISILFIVRLANLKLVEYYFQKAKYDESKKYFVRSINQINIKEHRFEFHFINNENVKKCFNYIKTFILQFPFFHLTQHQKISNQKIYFFENNDLDYLKKIENKENQLKSLYKLTKFTNNIITFDDPDELFDFIVFNDELKHFFINTRLPL